MSPFFAIFSTGLVLAAIGALLLADNSLVVTTIKALPRSPVATALFWGLGSLWFLHVVWNLSPADMMLFETPRPLAFFFGVIAVAAFYYVPDFLAVRGLSVLTLLAAWEVLMGTSGKYGWALPAKTVVYVAVVAAIYFGYAPYRARDFLQWLFNKGGPPPRAPAAGRPARMQRARVLGAAALVCGLAVAGTAFAR